MNRFNDSKWKAKLLQYLVIIQILNRCEHISIDRLLNDNIQHIFRAKMFINNQIHSTIHRCCLPKQINLDFENKNNYVGILFISIGWWCLFVSDRNNQIENTYLPPTHRNKKNPVGLANEETLEIKRKDKKQGVYHKSRFEFLRKKKNVSSFAK